MAKKSEKESAHEHMFIPPVQDKKRKAKILSTPVKSLQITKGMSVAKLVEGMGDMSIQARNIGTCARVLDGMMKDKKRPTIMLGLAGPLIAAGLRNVIRELIEGGYVDVVVSTGAILYQDIYQARGFKHYRGTPNSDDTVLRDLAIDRIYDTYVDEVAFISTDVWCGEIAAKMGPGIYSSRQYLEFLGKNLTDENSIVYQCAKHGVPIFAPAINDSSIGIGLTENRHLAHTRGKGKVCIDSIQDNYELAQIVVKSKRTAAIYVAGGVPKNYINDSIIMAYIFGLERGHHYAIQVTTAVTADGGLSSSTLGEAQSWGKIRRDATHAMAWVEPSVSIPLLAGYLFERYPKGRPHLKYNWKGEILKGVSVK